MKKVATNIYVSTNYPGVNVGFIALPEGAIAVDAPTLPQDARAWREQVVKKAGGPILYVVLTDAHPDRVLSVRLLDAPIVAARAAYERAAVYTEGFRRSVIESWARRYPEVADDLAKVPPALPEVMFAESVTLHKGGVDVTVRHVDGGAPGSSWIYFQEQDVLFAGDTVVVDVHPFMEAAPDTKAWLNTLKSLRRERYSDTIIVPGRGPLCDQAATQPLSEYIALARRRARSLQSGGRARMDKAAAVADLLSFFPATGDEHDLVQRRVKTGLDRLCEELKG
ncbi:MAG: MBL fold metallo-hydrolase [Anaerolineae bacterium]|jgi:glyoxylase-like metal-dependent hydrolase (beta-lactamase superfamily II)